MNGTCLHCRRNRWLKNRGLCNLCFRNPEIRAKYPTFRKGPKPKPKVKASPKPRPYRGKTLAQLEREIEQRRSTMPYSSEYASFQKQASEWTVPFIRLCPRGCRVMKGKRYAR